MTGETTEEPFKSGDIRVWPSRILVNITDPQVDQIHLEDIAWSLARQCRYNGHVEGFVSVAEHSMYVAKLLHDGGYGPDVVAQGLMHDAAEAYLGDLVMPLKHLPQIEAVLGPIEANMDRVIRERFGMAAEFDPAVKQADKRAGWEERQGNGHLRLRERGFGGSKPIEAWVEGFLAAATMAGISP